MDSILTQHIKVSNQEKDSAGCWRFIILWQSLSCMQQRTVLEATLSFLPPVLVWIEFCLCDVVFADDVFTAPWNWHVFTTHVELTASVHTLRMPKHVM